jgi:hypothetical protein
MAAKANDTERKSFRVPEVGRRNGFSTAFVYKQIAQGALKARKAGAATIITVEDEAAWLDAMPSMCNEPHAA